MLPTFIIIGAAKAGTTSLAEYLGAHPDVFMTDPKEPQFFARNWECGREWYESLFADAGDAIARGEASTHYTHAPRHPSTAARMASLVPDVRLVYLLRDPVDRIRAHYREAVANGFEHRPIDQAVRQNPRYVDFSRYAFQLDQYLACFERDDILVGASDDLRDDRRNALRQIFSFIGVDPSVEPPNIESEFNIAAEKRQARPLIDRSLRAMRRAGVPLRWVRRVRRAIPRAFTRPPDATFSPALEAQLWEQLQPDLVRLRSIVGPDFDLWGRA